LAVLDKEERALAEEVQRAVPDELQPNLPSEPHPVEVLQVKLKILLPQILQ